MAWRRRKRAVEAVLWMMLCREEVSEGVVAMRGERRGEEKRRRQACGGEEW